MLLVSSIDLIELNTNKMAFRPESNVTVNWYLHADAEVDDFYWTNYRAKYHRNKVIGDAVPNNHF